MLWLCLHLPCANRERERRVRNIADRGDTYDKGVVFDNVAFQYFPVFLK